MQKRRIKSIQKNFKKFYSLRHLTAKAFSDTSLKERGIISRIKCGENEAPSTRELSAMLTEGA